MGKSFRATSWASTTTLAYSSMSRATSGRPRSIASRFIAKCSGTQPITWASTNRSPCRTSRLISRIGTAFVTVGTLARMRAWSSRSRP